jgi:hypothetical protein
MHTEVMLMCQINVVLLVLPRKEMLMCIVLIALYLSNFFLALSLYPYEAKFVLKLLRDQTMNDRNTEKTPTKKAMSFNQTYRYIDDVLSFETNTSTL